MTSENSRSATGYRLTAGSHVVVAGLVLALLACAPGNPQKQKAENARGAELLVPFKKDLKQALMAGMQKGTVNAISVCKDEAPAIAESLSTEGVQMGRTSHRLGYVEPIATQPLCLACHGKSLAPDVATQIAEAYPEDQATGFEAGDLRGVFWVEYTEAE